ncbi:hypothetical protein [Streptomyces lunalinharesii]|uniref:hypothetical protein n=1 Tax=Streptomyces lunalinharesii TaxID=333384 RepID=UPI0031D30C97
MTDYNIYGTSSHTASELVRLAGSSLGLFFTERDSYYPTVRSRYSPTRFPVMTVKTTSTSPSIRRFRCC